MIRISSSALKSFEWDCSTIDFLKVVSVEWFNAEPRLLEEAHASRWFICLWTVNSLFTAN